MRTELVNIYRFSELSEETKQKAKTDFASIHGYIWKDEASESINKLAEHFDGKVTYWRLDYFGSSFSYMDFDMPEMTVKEIRHRLKQLGTYNKSTLKGNGECKLTGYSSDEDAIDGFRMAFIREKKTDLEKLMQAAFKAWLKAAQDDCEAYYSDESFSDLCEENNYEFTENGESY